MGAKSAPKLKAAELKKAYVDDLAAAWAFSRSKHRGDTPYAFVLWGVEDPIRLYTVVLTEESLNRVAQRYMKEGYHETLDEARRALRWSIADSPLEQELNQKIPKVDALVSPHASVLLSGGTYVALANAAMAALKELDSQGVFGKSNERERLVLAIITGDTEEDWSLKSVRRLNSESVLKRFRDETTSRLEGAPARCEALAVSRDGRSLYGAISRSGGFDEAEARSVSQIVACDVSGSRLWRRWVFSFPAFQLLRGAVACAANDAFVLALGAKSSGNDDTVLVRLPRNSNVPVQQLDIDSAGTFALSANDGRVVVNAGKTLQLFDAALRLVHSRDLDLTIHKMLFLRSGDLLVATTRELLRLDPTGDAVPASAPIPSFRLSTDDAEKLVAVSRLELDAESGVHLLHLPTLDPFRVITLPGHQGESAALSPDGRLLAFEAHDLTKPMGNPKRCFIVVFETATGREVARRKPHRLSVGALAFMGDNKTLAIGGDEYFATTDPIELWPIPGV